ncbi:MAG: PepSY-associated TM helix domain-containing protein [Deltaproteobacteria bacterium]|nr:PepSY-associated TM helix domain-containing protein [Deltaproteobacteria bacterium]
MRWRHLFRVIHRDVGYVAVALTLAFSLSGIAVNHIDDWNPNYRFDERPVDIGPLPAGDPAAMAAVVVRKLALDPRTVRGHFQETASDLRVFLPEGQEVRVDLRTGRGTRKTLTARAVFFEVNSLHLNNLKGTWTYVSDVFAFALMILAITGVSMMKGDRGFLGRGKYFVAAGLAVPVAAIVYMYS